MPLSVVNKYTLGAPKEHDVYIGRGSPLGNPYPIGKDGLNRAEVIKLYEGWFASMVQKREPSFVQALEAIYEDVQQGKDVRLVCFCSPKDCHGRIIKRFICNAL